MRTKVSKEDALKQAVEEFKFIVAYWNVARPQYRKEFKVNGRFSLSEVEKGFAIVNNWNKNWKNATQEEYDEYKKYSAAINFTFGLKSETLKPILHWYCDENGNRVQLKLSEIVAETSRQFAPIKVVNNGKINTKDKNTGEFRTIASWTSKYLIADKKIWESLFTPNSNKIEGIRINGRGASFRVIELVNKIRKANNSEDFNNKVNVVKKTKRNRPVKTPTTTPTPIPVQNDLNHKIRNWIDEYAFQFYKGGMTTEQLVEAYMSNPKTPKPNGYCPFTAESLKKHYDAKIEQ